MDERARALKALGLFDQMAKADRESGDSDLSAYTDHMADQGTEAMEREKAALFATKEGRYLYRIEEAFFDVGQLFLRHCHDSISRGVDENSLQK